MNNKFIKVYDKIIAECKDLCVERTTRSTDPEEYIKKIVEIARNQKKIHEFNDKYGLGIPYSSSFSGNYCKISDQMSIVYFGNAEEDKKKGSRNYISRSDDGRQPKEEQLLHIHFSTGAYFLSSEYTIDTFELMRQELKSFGPKYCDTTNRGLYFTLDKCREVCNKYPDIVKKYQDIAKKESIEKEKEILREKLKKLEVID